MDTIVILDRIRENVKIMAGEPYDKIVNDVDPANDDALGQHAGHGRHHAGRAAGLRRRLARRTSLSRCSSASARAAITRSSTRRRWSPCCRTGAAKRRSFAPTVARPLATNRARSPKLALKLPRRLSREQIVAARKERRTREKQAPARATGGPARYKRKRPAIADPGEAAAAESAGEQYEDEEYEALDPLDAQNAGCTSTT